MGTEFESVLQKPVSSPTEKQLASWLKEADKAMGSLERSIAGLVFMVMACLIVDRTKGRRAKQGYRGELEIIELPAYCCVAMRVRYKGRWASRLVENRQMRLLYVDPAEFNAVSSAGCPDGPCSQLYVPILRLSLQVQL